MADAKRKLPETDRGWQTYLANIRPPAEREWLPMGRGLTVCLEVSGERTFQARLRREGDANARRFRIGSFPALSVSDARKKLDEMKSNVREGRDPALAQRRARAGVVALRTLSDLIAEYLSRREGAVAAKTLKIEKELLAGILASALGDRLLADLEPVDFGKAVSDYAARLRREGRSNGTNANKLLAASRRMFKLARGWGLVRAIDPTAGLTKPAKEAPRDRILFDGRVLVGSDPKLNETGQLVSALLAEPSPLMASWPTRLALVVTLTLGLRAVETCSLVWSAIDLDGDAPMLTVTKSKTNAGLRTLPLPLRIVGLLRELRESAADDATFIFPAEEGAKRAKHMHPESLGRALARAGARLKLAHLSTHDLRRTCLSGLMELGHESVAERIAGHVPRHVLGRHYDRSSRLDAMRAGLEAWSRAIGEAADRHAAAERDKPTSLIL